MKTNGSRALDRAVVLLSAARRVVVTTGAGMSKESGVPTFRDAPDSLWAGYNPEELATPEGFLRDPDRVWRWYRDRRRRIELCRPHAGHEALARIETMFDDFLLVTQNIDNLHRQAGSSRLVEIHGNILRYRCFDRAHPYHGRERDGDSPPLCACGSRVRPDVVWFGEMLDAGLLERVFSALGACDVVLVVGTSGLVYPAAGFPMTAKNAGAKVIEVNPERTPITDIADAFVESTAAAALPPLIERIGSGRDNHP